MSCVLLDDLHSAYQKPTVGPTVPSAIRCSCCETNEREQQTHARRANEQISYLSLTLYEREAIKDALR